MGYENAPFHDDLYDFLQYEFGHTNDMKHQLILWPRGHAKTECVSFNYVSWLIGNYRTIHINLVSKTSTLAEEINTAQLTRIESDDRYRALWPDVKPRDPKKWTSKEFIVHRSDISKNPTVKASGLMGPITGGRSDLIICDDIIDEENVRTRLQFEKVDTWFNKVLFPTLYPWGAIIVIGTRWHYADLYAQLLAKWPSSVKQAIIDDEQHTVLWPEYWSYQKLQERRNEIGTLFFNCQYQNDPTGMEGDLLKAEWLHSWDTHPPPTCLLYAGVDPALGEGDLQAIATLAVFRGQAYLLDVWADKKSLPDFLDKLEQLHQTYHYAKIFVESNAFQKVLTFIPELHRGLPMASSPTVRDKAQRFIAMSSHFESQRILVNPFVNDQKSEFWTEWVQFPRGQYDDALDAVEIVARNTVGQPSRFVVKL